MIRIGKLLLYCEGYTVIVFCFVTRKIHDDKYNPINVRSDNSLSQVKSHLAKNHDNTHVNNRARSAPTYRCS